MREIARRTTLRAITGLALLGAYLGMVITGHAAPEALVAFVGGVVLNLWPSESKA